MRKQLLCLLTLLSLSLSICFAQGTVPTFVDQVNGHAYTLVGKSPQGGGSTSIRTVLVPVTLSIAGGAVMNAAPDVPEVLRSPVFSRFAFPHSAGETQYGDALLRATFPQAPGWHTLFAQPSVRPLHIDVPAVDGYLLTSHRSGGQLAVVDADFVQKQIMQQLGKQPGSLIVAITHNVTFYADGDATICCTWGTHGVDAATGNSFVLGSVLHSAPAIVQDRDVQPLTQQLGEFMNDPLHDPMRYGFDVAAPGNTVPAWMRDGSEGGCGGIAIGSAYFLLEPTDTNLKNDIPASPPFALAGHGATYHLENVALLPWYLGSGGVAPHGAFSFPDPAALPTAAVPCRRGPGLINTATPVARSAGASSHQLIGYWTGHGPHGEPFPLSAVSPQWDVIIVAFAAPVPHAPEGTLRFELPRGISDAQFRADMAALKSKGKKIMISLGGGGAFFSLANAAQIPYFVKNVTAIVANYGFDGVDIDFETPSLVIDPGDTDFRHPTTPSVVNLTAGLRQIQRHFGPRFMLSLVPEGPQIPAGYVRYAGQFGSYLPLVYALHDILTFVDVQDYNTPPLEGLDGEIYQSHTVDYHAALTELLLHGFTVSRDSKQFFPPLPASQVAVGFLTDYSQPREVSEAMRYLITGKAPAGTAYQLHRLGGYPALRGAMFWTIDDDARRAYEFSNWIGPQLHSYHTH